MDEISVLEQLEKRIEWLDNERRNDKNNLASLQNRLTVLEGDNIALRKQIKDMETEVAKLTSQIASIDRYENRIDRLNTDLTKQIRDVNERADLNINESAKRLKLEIEAIRRSISELYSFTEHLEPIRNELKTYKVEDARLARQIEELKGKIAEATRFDDDYRRSLHLLEENFRQQGKVITDFQGEVVSLRKRLEEMRGRFDSVSDSFKTLDTRITELMTYERDRKETQAVFMDKVNNSLLDKEKTFKTWEKRFEDIDKININLSSQLEDLEKAKAAVDKAVTNVDEVTQRFERRINEISEMQRLSDERFLQEWNTFKSDDVKRWSNYLLAQEEQTRSINQQITQAQNQIEALTENTANLQEDLNRLANETFQHVQLVLTTYQETIQSLAPLAEKKAP
jgi:chromosome segregation ATPase